MGASRNNYLPLLCCCSGRRPSWRCSGQCSCCSRRCELLALPPLLLLLLLLLLSELLLAAAGDSGSMWQKQ